MNDKDEILDCNIHFAAFSKRLPSQFIQVKLTVAYLKKMTGFYEYMPQRPHASLVLRLSHRPVLDYLQYAKWRGKVWSILSCKRHQCLLGRQGE